MSDEQLKDLSDEDEEISLEDLAGVAGGTNPLDSCGERTNGPTAEQLRFQANIIRLEGGRWVGGSFSVNQKKKK